MNKPLSPAEAMMVPGFDARAEQDRCLAVMMQPVKAGDKAAQTRRHEAVVGFSVATGVLIGRGEKVLDVEGNPPLADPAHDDFAFQWALGRSAVEALKAAKLDPDTVNADDLALRPEIIDRADYFLMAILSDPELDLEKAYRHYDAKQRDPKPDPAKAPYAAGLYLRAFAATGMILGLMLAADEAETMGMFEEAEVDELGVN